MSSNLSIQVDDPEMENLLQYLESRFGQNSTHKIRVLRLAEVWLGFKASGTFSTSEECTPVLELVVPAKYPTSVSPA
jgi:hypothetical protein